MNTYYITTAIDYVNAPPHIGHAYEKIAADALARFYRLKGKEVFFLTGVDEHGSKIERMARQSGKDPKDFCDVMSKEFQDTWQCLGISYDYFIRTTEVRHFKSVQTLFKRLQAKGDIYKAAYEGLYCEGCEDFVRQRDLNELGHCPNHGKAPRPVSEENYFFRLSKYKPIIKEWLQNNPHALQPESRRRQVLNQLDDPELTDFSVSRSISTLNWGIPVPDDPNQIIYVWLDALTNYITGAGFATDESSFKRWWPADLHLIGKDISKFHAVYWPAMLLSGDIEVPKHIYAHGFLTVEGQKISKTLGNVIDPKVLVSKFGSDAVRFFLLAATPFDQDGDFSQEELLRKVNAELANNLGNLLNRTLTLVEKNCSGMVPQAEPDAELADNANELDNALIKFMEKLEFAKAIGAILALVDQTNRYINDQKPWAIFKDGSQKDGQKVLYTALEILRRTALNMYPFAPQLAVNMWQQLGYTSDLAQIGSKTKGNVFSDAIPPGQKILNRGPVFMRIESAQISAPV